MERTQDLDLPYGVDLSYVAADKGYDVGTQSHTRAAKSNVEARMSVDTAIVLSDDEARRCAARILYTAWLEREQFRFSLPPRYVRYGPGSIMDLPVDGVLERVRFVRTDLGLPGPIGVTAVKDDEDVVSQTVSGVTIAPSSPPVGEAVPTDFLPESSVSDDPLDGLGAGFYVVATGADRWKGAAVYYSLTDTDTLADWTYAGGIAGRGAFYTVAKELPTWAVSFDPDESAIKRFSVPDSLVGETLYIRAVSPYEDIADVTSQTVVVYAPASPYAPASSGLSSLFLEFPLGTPFSTGAVEDLVVRLPKKQGASVTWAIDRIVLRAETAGSTDTTALLESSAGGAAFSASTVETVTLPASSREASDATVSGTFASDTLLRVNVSAIGTGVQNLSLSLELTQQ